MNELSLLGDIVVALLVGVHPVFSACLSVVYSCLPEAASPSAFAQQGREGWRN